VKKTPEEELAEYQAQAQRECRQEYLQSSPVHGECGYVSFVSKSKGRRKDGSQILRRNWKEVELFRRSNGWHLPHNFPFDSEAQELLGRETSDEELVKQMRELCDRKGGRGKTDDWTRMNLIRKGMNKVKGYRFQLI